MKYLSKEALKDAQEKKLAVRKLDHHETNTVIVIICDNQKQVQALLDDDNRDCYSMSAAYWYATYDGKFHKDMMCETYEEHTEPVDYSKFL